MEQSKSRKSTKFELPLAIKWYVTELIKEWRVAVITSNMYKVRDISHTHQEEQYRK